MARVQGILGIFYDSWFCCCLVNICFLSAHVWYHWKHFSFTPLIHALPLLVNESSWDKIWTQNYKTKKNFSARHKVVTVVRSRQDMAAWTLFAPTSSLFGQNTYKRCKGRKWRPLLHLFYVQSLHDNDSGYEKWHKLTEIYDWARTWKAHLSKSHKCSQNCGQGLVQT